MNLPLNINEQFVKIRVFFQRKGTKMRRMAKFIFFYTRKSPHIRRQPDHGLVRLLRQPVAVNLRTCVPTTPRWPRIHVHLSYIPMTQFYCIKIDKNEASQIVVEDTRSM